MELEGVDNVVKSPVENGERSKPYLYSLRNRQSNKLKFTDIDMGGAPLSGISCVVDRYAKRVADGAASNCLFLTLKGLKAKKIDMKLTRAYGDEVLQISAVKKWECVSCRGEQSSEMTSDQEGLPILS
jgi:hypothetical protein